jgi:two-component system sensor kinase FixL
MNNKITSNQDHSKGMERVVKKVDLLHHKLRELENEKKVLTALLTKEKENSQKRTEILAIALHDLRSPLTSIQLSASIIQHYYHRLDQQKLVLHLGKIEVAVKDFAILLNDFLPEEIFEKTKL